MYSCLTQLTDFILIGMDDFFPTGMNQVDLQKADDKLDHIMFLQKMDCVDFMDLWIAWIERIVFKQFQSYLSERNFFFRHTNRCLFR